MFSGIVIFCFYSFIRLKEMLPVEEYGYDAIFFIPVSYTHLDVYKRQPPTRPLPCAPLR